MKDFQPMLAATLRSNSIAALISLNSYWTRGSSLEIYVSLTHIEVMTILTRYRLHGNMQEYAMLACLSPC